MIRRFSRVVLQPGLHRDICLLERPDDRPALLIATSQREGSSRWRRRVRLTSFWFFAGELAPLLAALDEARRLAPARIVTCGETRLPSGAVPSGAVLVVGASSGAVRLQFRAPDGRLLGQPTVLDGGEIGALELAAHHLASLPPPTLTRNQPMTNTTIPTTHAELKLEAEQLAKSIAAALAAGQGARAEALTARRERVLARVSA